MTRNHRDMRRSKLIKLLHRSKLEELATVDRPWNADRRTLEFNVMANWDHDAITDAIMRILEGAK